MRFLVRKRRSAPAVTIVALIDVLIVLVIFLLVTTTFKQQSSLRLVLPESTQALKPGANENPPLVVTIDDKGLLRLGDESQPVTLEQLRGQLQAKVAAQPNLKLAVRADKNAPWGKVVNILDLAKQANIKITSAFMREAGKP